MQAGGKRRQPKKAASPPPEKQMEKEREKEKEKEREKEAEPPQPEPSTEAPHMPLGCTHMHTHARNFACIHAHATQFRLHACRQRHVYARGHMDAQTHTQNAF